MKSLSVALIILLAAVAAWAQSPDPADSIILESKSVAPGVGSPYMTVKVYITNKDTLAALVLAVKEVSTSGGAYGILSRHASGNLTFSSVITNLASCFRVGTAGNFSGYDNSSPDSFLVAALYDNIDCSPPAEPPNVTRKAVWEIKFDTVRSSAGTFELDSAHFASQPFSCYFTKISPVADLPVNFAKSVITVAFPPGVPDPRDSIILESKTVTPGVGRPYTTVKVYITNKDTLAALVLALKKLSTSGGAYGILERTSSGLLTFGSVITNLTSSFRVGIAYNFRGYDNSSPDTFLVAAYSDGDFSPFEPPNAARKAVWEIKFDTVRSEAGTFELDSARVSGNASYFSSLRPLLDLPVNFVKSVVTVTYPKGDFNQDFRMSAADIVTLIGCVFSPVVAPNCGPFGTCASCDLNCDGQLSAADVVLEVNFVFNQEPFPC